MILDDNLYESMLDVYDYIEKVFYSKAPKDVMFRYNWGERGIAEKILSYIWNTYIEPKGENNE